MTKKEYQAGMAYLQDLKEDAITDGEMKKPMLVSGFIKHMENLLYVISTAETKPPRKKRVGFHEEKDAFVRKHMGTIKTFGVGREVITLARKELGYSPKTYRNDIRSSLERAYRKVNNEKVL